jgi:RimJ/RimL family protein N-acetyltransferase
MRWAPETIDLGDVALRRWAIAHVPALTTAVVESLPHLQPWMVWATPDEATEEAFTRFREETAARSAEGHEAVFGIFDARTGAVLGGVGLHDRVGPTAVELGYWLHVAATGRGLMTRIVAHLTDLALAQEAVTWVEIRCDEANTASAAVPRRLGFALAATIASDRPQAPADTGRDLIWTRTTPIGALPT